MRLLRTLLFLSLLLAACAPVGTQVPGPKAKLVGQEVLAVDPFSDRVKLRLDLELQNPHRFEVPLLESTLKVKLGEMVAEGTLPAVTLPPKGSARAPLVVEASLARSARTVAELLAGRELPLVVTGEVWVDAMGRRIAIGPYTLLEDRVRFRVDLRPPEIRPVGAGVRLKGGNLRFEVRLKAKNPTPVGFRVAGDLAAELAGKVVGEIPLRLDLPPRAEREGQVALSVPLSQVPGIVGRLGRGAAFALVGDLRLVVPGVLERTFPVQITGSLR